MRRRQKTLPRDLPPAGVRLIDWLVFHAVPLEIAAVPEGEPTPEEIRQRCEALRSRWSTRQTAIAEGAFRARPATVPTYDERILVG